MSTPAPQPPPPGGYQPPPTGGNRSPWGVLLAAVVALALGVAAGVLIAGSGDENVKTVTHAKTVSTGASSTDVTVSVPTTTTTVEKTVTVTVTGDQTAPTATSP